MSYNLKLPNITAGDAQGQLQQMNSYLYQMVEQLNWSLNIIDLKTGGDATPAQDSGVSGSDTDKTPMETFSNIKSLIIKSADIVNAYYEQINKKLEGLYVAQSTFGSYQEETRHQIQENSTAIERNFRNIQNLTANIASIESILVGVNAYINSGLLFYDEDGIPVYGIEVGQRTEVNGTEIFNRYARFTANKLSFYDANSNEVAYISDYKLYISNVEITGDFKQGSLVASALSDGSIVRRYVGG